MKLELWYDEGLGTSRYLVCYPDTIESAQRYMTMYGWVFSRFFIKVKGTN